MRVLFIEDDPAQVEVVIRTFQGQIDFDHVATRDDALALLEAGTYDVAVCDLKIPPTSEGVADVEHGLAVLTAILDRCPGTPVIGFTAYKTKEVLELLLREQRREDYLGTLEPRPMLRVMEKDELPEFLAELQALQTEFDLLESIEVAMAFGHQPVDDLVRRVLRVYARQRQCVILHILPLTGGQSGVPVLRIKMERSDGSMGGSAVARIARVPAVDEEFRQFQSRVSGVLPIGGYAEIVGIVKASAGLLGGVFYQLAEDYRPLFEILADDDDRAAAAVEHLQTLQGPWREGAPAEQISMREVRRILISDSRWAACSARCGLDAGSVAELESRTIRVRRATVHGDLHGENVLVADRAVMIDFASVTDGPTPLDPVSLELSLLFHPHAPGWPTGWPDQQQLAHWGDFDRYLIGCPFPKFVRSCRKWAQDVARGNADVYAAAYSYVASQARFDTSRDDRLMALMLGLRSILAEPR